MAELDTQIRISAVDEVTPVLKGIQRRIFWWHYGPVIASSVLAAVALVVGFVAGLQVP